jgi:hypothetical protein
MFNVTMWCVRITIATIEKQQFVLGVLLSYMSLSTVQNNFFSAVVVCLRPLPR